MAVDERARAAIYEKLEAAFGAKVASDVMEHLPKGGASGIATKPDLEALEQRLRAELASKKDLEILEHKLMREITEVRSEVHRTTKNIVLSMTPVLVALNGIMFAALRLT